MTNILEIPAGPLTTVICLCIVCCLVFLILLFLKMTTKKEEDLPKTGKTDMEIDIKCWNEMKTPVQALEEIGKDPKGFRPATAEEVEFNLAKILDLEEHFPDFQKHLPIVALGYPDFNADNSLVLYYKSFSYEEDEDTGEFHVASSRW